MYDGGFGCFYILLLQYAVMEAKAALCRDSILLLKGLLLWLTTTILCQVKRKTASALLKDFYLFLLIVIRTPVRFRAFRVA